MISTVATYLPRLARPLLPHVLSRIETSERVLYLTFDDGPSEVTTDLLEVLDAHGAHGTFFLIGQQVLRYPESVATLTQRGHGIGNHGYRHRDPWLRPRRPLLEDFQENRRLLQEMTGIDALFCRPPYGHWRPVLDAWARRTGSQVVLWDVMPGDYLRFMSLDRLVSFTRRTVRTGSIIVLHDAPRAPALLKQLLPALSADGWRLTSLSRTPAT